VLANKHEEQVDPEESRKQSNLLSPLASLAHADVNTNEGKCIALCLRLEKMILARESYALRKLIT